MTIVRYISKWDEIPTGGVLVDAETERAMTYEQVTPREPWEKSYTQIYDHNGFELMKTFSKYIPKGLKIKFKVER